MMFDAENELFADTVDTAKEGIEQHKKQESFKGATTKENLLGAKNNGDVKGLIKLATKLSIKHIY